MNNRITLIAKKLRRKQTPHEIKLWALLRDRRFGDYKFRRQCPIDKYIVDFCCYEKKLIIELDGGGHNEQKQIQKDIIRDNHLNNQGFIILRVWNNELDENLDGVFQRIYEILN